MPANDAWDSGDDTGNGATTLTPTTTEQSHGPHTLSGTDSYDWFKVYLSAGYSYNFNTFGGSGDNFGELYSVASGLRVAYNDDSDVSTQFSFDYTPTETGWYYLLVRAYTIGNPCSYYLKYSILSSPSTTTTVPTTTTTSRTTTSTSRSTTSTSRTTTSASTTSTSLSTTTIPGGYLCHPAGDAALTTAGSYDGYFYSAGAFGGAAALTVRGTLSVKVTGTAGKLTAKAVIQKGSLSFISRTWAGTDGDGTVRATLAARGGETLDLFVRQNRIWGTLAAAGETLIIEGARSRFAVGTDSAAQASLDSFRGYYTVSLPTHDWLSLGNPEPEGAGYLAVTVGNKGSAKIAGVLADGTKVSRSSRLILFDGCRRDACVPFFAPLYMKQGWAGGLLWLTPNGGAVVTDRDKGWLVRWEKPVRGPDGFSMLLDACGGFYGTGASLAAAYLFSAGVGEVPYYYAGGSADWVAAPDGVPVAAAGGRMTIAKGAKPVKASGDGGSWYEYDDANPAAATLTFASRTGIFKGRFSLYYDYDMNGMPAHKAVSVPYAGVLTPVRDSRFAELPAGMGHCLVPDTNPALTPYKIRRSFPVRLEAAP